MNDDLNDLEAELRSFRPAPVSSELRDRVASQLERTEDMQPVRRHRWQRWSAPALQAAAALILLAFVSAWLYMTFLRNDQEPSPQAPPKIAVQDPPAEDIQAPPRPTRWAYQLAAADSPEELDALLDQHAAVLLPRSPNLDLTDVMLP